MGWLFFRLAVIPRLPLLDRAVLVWWGGSWLTNVVMLTSPIFMFSRKASFARHRDLMRFAFPVAAIINAALVLHPGIPGMSRELLKLSGSLVHDYATISDDSPSPNRASRARRAATSAGIS